MSVAAVALPNHLTGRRTVLPLTVLSLHPTVTHVLVALVCTARASAGFPDVRGDKVSMLLAQPRQATVGVPLPAPKYPQNRIAPPRVSLTPFGSGVYPGR
jgi:hypothetical protein